MPFIVIMVGLGLGLIFLLVFVIKSALFGRHIRKNFEMCNVIVDGKKGTGKDLLFQYVISKRKAHYYANIDYGGDYEHITAKDISIEPNTFDNFINGNVVKVNRRFRENCDVYISDGGVFLPSFADSTLHKTYKSLPLCYPLSRHLWNGNVHVNVQNFNRVWKPLREQADFWVHVTGKVKLPFVIFVKAITYDRQQSAESYLLPIKKRLLNKYSKAEADVYQASNGTIKQGWVCVWKRKIKYNTRAFEPVLYGDTPRLEAPPKPPKDLGLSA